MKFASGIFIFLFFLHGCSSTKLGQTDIVQQGKVEVQTSLSKVYSDELMQRIITLETDSEFRHGDAKKRAMLESYLQEIMNRAKSKQPSAMFYYGFYRYQICIMGKKQGLDVSSAPMCTQAFEDIKTFAENEKIKILFMSPSSMSILGGMYSGGIGTKRSKYLAAEWFIKSAKQWEANGDRENAIRTLEDAMNEVPDYPEAIKLRKKLLK